jgi:5-deoxy-glucuronate isomerase
VELHHHYASAPGYTQLVAPHTHPVERLDFGVLRLEGGQTYEMASNGSEVGLVILGGTCSLRVNGGLVAALGGRASVFDGRASGAYVPPDASLQVEAGASGVEVAMCRCAASATYPVHVIRPADIVVHQVGGPGYLRYVHDILGPQMQAASMLVGETFTVAGNWSSFPPHKHDVEALPDEVKQEELYFYKIRPVEGFGIQYLYSREGSPYGALEQALAVHQDDITIIPFGYHPVAAPPGYDVYYLWFLAGATRLMRPHDDPAYAWIKTAREDARDYPR